VVDHFFERSGACCESTARSCGVHEVRAGRTCPSRRMARRPLQTRSAGHAQDLSSSGELRPGREQPSRARRRNRQRNLVGSRIPGKPRRTGRQDESRRYRGVDGTRTLARDAVISNHRPRRNLARRQGRRLSRPPAGCVGV
jgi:hypothetical protein